MNISSWSMSDPLNLRITRLRFFCSQNRCVFDGVMLLYAFHSDVSQEALDRKKSPLSDNTDWSGPMSFYGKVMSTGERVWGGVLNI